MFKLIALVMLKDGAPVDELLQKAREFLSREPHFVRYALQRDAGQGQHDAVQHATFAVLCDFSSADDWRRYVAGPTHAELDKLFSPWSTGAIVLQYNE